MFILFRIDYNKKLIDNGSNFLKSKKWTFF